MEVIRLKTLKFIWKKRGHSWGIGPLYVWDAKQNKSIKPLKI
jgi:hypothetical protein